MGLFNRKKKSKEEESAEEEERMDQGYFLHIEQEVEESERKQMHNERDEKNLDVDKEDEAPDETKVPREAGAEGFRDRKKKNDDSPGKDKRPLK